jgi:hypothetical protein
MYPAVPHDSPYCEVLCCWAAVFSADLAATIYQSLGIDPATEVRDRLNRPVRLCTGEPIAPLFSAARTVG